MSEKRVTYSFEVATNAATAVWRVADRSFWDRRLTLKEYNQAWGHERDIAKIATALSVLKVEGEEITEDWVREHLTEDDAVLTMIFILQGKAGVTKHLKAKHESA